MANLQFDNPLVYRAAGTERGKKTDVLTPAMRAPRLSPSKAEWGPGRPLIRAPCSRYLLRVFERVAARLGSTIPRHICGHHGTRDSTRQQAPGQPLPRPGARSETAPCQATLKTDPLATPKTDPRRNGVCRSTSGGSPRPASVVDGRDAPSRPGRRSAATRSRPPGKLPLAVTPEAPGQIDGLQYRQVQIADLLEQPSGRGPGEGFRQRFPPLPILVLQRQERPYRVVPLLWPRPPICRPAVPDPSRAGLPPLPVTRLSLRVRQRHDYSTPYVTDR